MSRIKRREPLTQQLADRMRRRIESGRFKQGRKLPSENELIDEFGVSRAVVREAISNLKAIGMVTTRQGAGAFVASTAANAPFQVQEASLDVLQEVIAVLELRIAIEVEAAFLAATRRTADDLKALKSAVQLLARSAEAGTDDGVTADLAFHTALARATGNPHFLRLFGYLGAMLIPRSRVRAFAPNDRSRQEFIARIVADHQAILDAIERRDAEGARDAMAEHLQRTRGRLQKASQLRKRARAGK